MLTLRQYIQDGEKQDVKYLREDLLKEYNRLSEMAPDIDGIVHPLINTSDVLHAYFILADYFTDESGPEEIENMLVGLRSNDLLGSAIGRQTVSFEGKKKYTEPLKICATLFYGLVKDHAFVDGNKRTALLILLYQLTLFGYIPSAPINEYEDLVMAVAANNVNKKYVKEWGKFEKRNDSLIDTIAYLLKRMTKKKDGSYHFSPTMKDFCSALNKTHSVNARLDNGKIHFVRIEKKLWKISEKKYQHTVPFGGWTRTVGAKTARETLKALNLYDQYATYRDIFDKQEPLYSLVDQFSVPLRRLKDE